MSVHLACKYWMYVFICIVNAQITENFFMGTGRLLCESQNLGCHFLIKIPASVSII